MSDTMTSIQPGDVVSGLEPGELVEVQRVSPFGGKALVEGVGAQSRKLVRRPLSAAYLLNCLPSEAELERPDLPERARAEIEGWAYEQITEPQLSQVTTARKEECDLRRQYLNNAFTDLILELQEKLNDLQEASLVGEHNAEEREVLHSHIQDLKARKLERLRELDLMMNLNGNLPEVITQALVIPVPVATIEPGEGGGGGGFPMHRDDEVEQIAMDTVLRYERSRGWTPYDVHHDVEHYDIRSESPGGEKRYIEAKGRAQSGPVVLTGPEVDKLRQLGDRAWLYIVTLCRAERPRLHLIQDPIPKLHPEMLYRQVQYLVQEADWYAQAVEVAQ